MWIQRHQVVCDHLGQTTLSLLLLSPHFLCPFSLHAVPFPALYSKGLDVKCHRHKIPTQSEHLSSTHSLLRVSCYPSIHVYAFALLSFRLLFMPFFRFIATCFSTSPPNPLFHPGSLIHPSFCCFSLTQSSSDSQTKTFAPWTPPPFLSPGPQVPAISIKEVRHW